MSHVTLPDTHTRIQYKPPISHLQYISTSTTLVDFLFIGTFQCNSNMSGAILSKFSLSRLPSYLIFFKPVEDICLKYFEGNMHICIYMYIHVYIYIYTIFFFVSFSSCFFFQILFFIWNLRASLCLHVLRSYFYYRIHLQNRVRSCFFLQNIFYDYVKLQFIINYY